MRKVKLLVAATVMAFSGLIGLAAPAGAVVCIEDGGASSCCEDPVILGKEYNLWDCMT